MRTSQLYILLSLSGQDRHGSGIARDVLAMTDGRVRLWPAALYGALDELRRLEWIASVRAPRDAGDPPSERKRYYRLTRSGRTALAAETERLAGLVEIARVRTGAKGATAR